MAIEEMTPDKAVDFVCDILRRTRTHALHEQLKFEQSAQQGRGDEESEAWNKEMWESQQEYVAEIDAVMRVLRGMVPTPATPDAAPREE